MGKKLWILMITICMSYTVTGQKIITKKLLGRESINGQRELKIFLPEGYETPKNKDKNYPLAIILDSEYFFDLYVANSKLFAKADKAPKQIVVGINSDKKQENDFNFDSVNQRLSKTNISFMNYIKDDVLPFLEGSYRTSPFVSLVGYGASTNIITTFLKDTNPLFNAFVCINAKFHSRMHEDIKSFELDNLSKNDNTYYYYINNNPNFNAIDKSAIEQVNEQVSNITAKNFNVKYDETNSSNVITAMSEAIPRAITNIFELYSGISNNEFKSNVSHLNPLDAITYLETKYLDIDFLFGSSLGIRERDIHAVEKLIIDKENGVYLKKFGEMILNAYPKSHMGHYYIGLYYEKQGKVKQALKHYKRGYGKMDPSDPRSELFYNNIERLSE